jgi:hypothetical protein
MYATLEKFLLSSQIRLLIHHQPKMVDEMQCLFMFSAKPIIALFTTPPTAAIACVIGQLLAAHIVTSHETERPTNLTYLSMGLSIWLELSEAPIKSATIVNVRELIGLTVRIFNSVEWL